MDEHSNQSTVRVLSMSFLMATGAEGDQILCRVIAQVGSAIECDGLEDPPFARTIGNASHLAPELPGRAGDKLQAQASSVAALHGSLSKRHLDFFKELLPLRLRKTNDQPGEARQ